MWSAPTYVVAHLALSLAFMPTAAMNRFRTAQAKALLRVHTCDATVSRVNDPRLLWPTQVPARANESALYKALQIAPCFPNGSHESQFKRFLVVQLKRPLAALDQAKEPTKALKQMVSRPISSMDSSSLKPWRGFCTLRS